MKLTYSQYQIFDYIPGFVYLQASDFSIVYANKRFIELFGKPEGRHCYEIIENRDKPCEICPTFSVFRTKEPQRRRWESPSGRKYMIYNNYFVDDDGRGLILKIGMDITEEEKRREIVEELTLQQKEQIKIIDSGPAVVFLWKAEENWPVVTVSSNVTRFGYDPDDFITGIISYADIIHPDDLPRVLSEVEYNSKNHIDDYNQEYRIFGKDHTEYWVEDHTFIRRDESGKITHYQGIVLDITDRKKVEEELKEKEERYRSTLDNMMEGCQIIDFDWRYVYLNDVAVKHSHKSRDDLIGKTMMEAYPGIDKADFFVHLRDCIDKRISYKMENEFIYPDGSVGWFNLNVEPVPEGIFILSEDITESKKAYEEIKELSSFREKIIEDPEVWIVVSDIFGNVIIWNKAAEKITGYNSSEVIGNNDIWKKITPHVRDRKKLSRKISKIRKIGGMIEELPFPIRTKSGEDRYILLSLRTLADENKVTFAVVGMGVDITSRKKAEKSLMEKQINLEEALKEKDIIIGEIHHRVKNNLQIISALLQMQRYTIDDLKYSQLFENMNDRVLAIANVYENLIEREEFLEIHMPKLINDLVSNAILSHPHTTDLSVDTDVMDEKMDLNVAVSLSMIISELLINTVKHAFVGRKKGHVNVYLQREGDMGYLLEISDDGIGYHGETDLSKAETLGLRLVGILVENNLHGTVDIEVNGGTKFSIRFV